MSHPRPAACDRGRAGPGPTLAAIAWALLAACRPDPAPVVVASTTSLEDTGLLEAILPAFAADQPEYRARVIAVGTGEALALGRRGDADVVIVHAPEAEEEFVRSGYGHRRTPFLRNDFVIAGPPEDPAGVRGLASAPAALAAIATAAAPFVSRGDGSGTHIRERQLWRLAGVEPQGAWYIEAGQGMGATLLIAGERRAYALTDRATLVTSGGRPGLEALVAGDSLLANIYSVIEVRGSAEPEGARVFARWLVADATVARMAAFGRERFGSRLFHALDRADAGVTPTGP